MLKRKLKAMLKKIIKHVSAKSHLTFSDNDLVAMSSAKDMLKTLTDYGVDYGDNLRDVDGDCLEAWLVVYLGIVHDIRFTVVKGMLTKADLETVDEMRILMDIITVNTRKVKT